MNVFEWKKALAPLPYVAILRGLQPENTQAVIGELCESDFRAVEIPFNSPDPLKALKLLCASSEGIFSLVVAQC